MARQRRTSRFVGLALLAGVLAALAPVLAPSGPQVRASAPDSPGGDPVSAASSFSTPPVSRPPLVGSPDGREHVLDVYRRRSLALAAGDRPAWESTVADPASDAGREQLLAYDNLRALGVTELTVGEVTSAAQQAGTVPAADTPGANGPPPADQERPATATFVVQLGHRIPGFDRGPRVAARTVTLEVGPGGWRTARDRSPSDQLQVWDLADLRVQRSASALVAGNVDADVLARRLVDAEAGQARVREVLAAPVPAVLVVPRTGGEAARQLGRPEGMPLGPVAASTDGSTSSPGADAPAASAARADRVVLNPDAFAGLTEEGRQVVVTHELAHVAMRANVPGRVPLWLSEGLAEYVAWAPVRMPIRTAAARLLEQVRSAGAPETLPADGDFDPVRGDVAPSYQAAWLAVRHLASEHGDGRLRAFYRALAEASGESATREAVERAFVTELGTTLARFEDEWRAYLQQLAS